MTLSARIGTDHCLLFYKTLRYRTQTELAKKLYPFLEFATFFTLLQTTVHFIIELIQSYTFCNIQRFMKL